MKHIPEASTIGLFCGLAFLATMIINAWLEIGGL